MTFAVACNNAPEVPAVNEDSIEQARIADSIAAAEALAAEEAAAEEARIADSIRVADSLASLKKTVKKAVVKEVKKEVSAQEQKIANANTGTKTFTVAGAGERTAANETKKIESSQNGEKKTFTKGGVR